MKSRWSSKSLGNKWQHQFFYLLIKLGSWPAGYVALFFVVTVYSCIPAVRNRSKPYLQRRFPGAGRLEMALHYWKHQWCFGKVLVDRATAGIRNTLKVEASQEDIARLKELYDRGKGVLVLSAHVGCWQTAMLGVEKSIGARVHVLLHKDAQDVDRHYHEHGNSMPAFTTINANDPFSLMNVSTALQQGAMVVSTADREWGKSKYMTSVPFMGGMISLPWALHHLAAICQSPVVICYAIRKGPCRVLYSISAIQDIPKPENKTASQYIPFLRAFAETLESTIQQHPYQFFNFYNLWEPNNGR